MFQLGDVDLKVPICESVVGANFWQGDIEAIYAGEIHFDDHTLRTSWFFQLESMHAQRP